MEYHQSDTSRQTHQEWWADYDSGSEQPVAEAKPVPATGQPIPLDTQFRYVDHRTTCRRSVGLEFESLDGSIRAVMFCNVKLKSPRGKSYPAGDRGQFIPPERGKFRKFWKQTVGIDPWRWCRVHKSMRSALGPLLFKAQYERASDGKGQSYFKITSITAI